MDEKQFGKNIAVLRKEAGLTQDDLGLRLHVSPQAVSKWENDHSLPETALLPSLAKLLGVTIDELFSVGELVILEALYGDGIDAVNVTKRLNRLIENEVLRIPVSESLLGVTNTNGRASFLTLKYKTQQGICYAAFSEGSDVHLSSGDQPTILPENNLFIIAGCYGTRAHHYDVMPKIEHYRPFNWNAYHANHETFPSDPANDATEYLTLAYLNHTGIHMATCAEGESLAYRDDHTELARRIQADEYFIPHVPTLPPFGSGMECSWAASLTGALQAMKLDTDYTEVMGNTGACYRLAFCSPGWDYSSVDGLVVYDYATPGFSAYGFIPEMHGHIEKADRAGHRARIMKEIRNDMPVLGINLRVAPEWGLICGYRKEGGELFCRTKYDKPTIENDPIFMKGHPPFQKEWLGPYEYMQVDNWPFLLCYFTGRQTPPSSKENLLASLRIFLDCAAKPQEGGYYMSFKAYEIWAADLRDDTFYQGCDDEQFARRFSVNQFCTLSLYDARKSARDYLDRASVLFEGSKLTKITDCFTKIAENAELIHKMLDSGEELSGDRCREFWRLDKRHSQATWLDEMAALEREAYGLAKEFLSKHDLILLIQEGK